MLPICPIEAFPHRGAGAETEKNVWKMVQAAHIFLIRCCFSWQSRVHSNRTLPVERAGDTRPTVTSFYHANSSGGNSIRIFASYEGTAKLSVLLKNPFLQWKPKKRQTGFNYVILFNRYAREQECSQALCDYSDGVTFHARFVDNDLQTRKERTILP